MRSFTLMTTAILNMAAFSLVHADDTTPPLNENAGSSASIKVQNNETSIRELKNLKAQNFKVDAKANQPDNVKDPLQPLNRQIYAINDRLDQHIVRPLAVQYVKKVPQPVRGSYRTFRKNLGEPWNAVNQLIQGRPVRALKTMGRFSVNTLTSLGFADTAQHFGLTTEDENFGTTLGYYGVPSGPYVVLPFFGPNTFRSTLGIAVDSQGRPQKYIFSEHSLYWTEQTLRGLDVRAQLLDIEGVLSGDKYAQIRDIYLQRTDFLIAEKRGLTSEDLFADDDFSDDEFDESDMEIDIKE